MIARHSLPLSSEFYGKKPRKSWAVADASTISGLDHYVSIASTLGLPWAIYRVAMLCPIKAVTIRGFTLYVKDGPVIFNPIRRARPLDPDNSEFD